MSVRTREMEDDRQVERRAEAVRRRLIGSRVLAICMWVVSTFVTYQGMTMLLPDRPMWQTAIAALFAQIVCTWMESPAILGRPNGISLIFVLIDTLINAGGIYPMARNVGGTPTAQMIIDAGSLAPVVPPSAALVIAIVFGFLLAIIPESLWRWRS